ncbi:MAG TPA: diaminopimelate epimerase [Candidatus Eisenbacteria bacterium]|uniref:Diaminopimelate epimerase n=1 Tax=Eiseniibacteriota bacterium TaxID=2212470 RepID=A0A7V2AVU4_UNCEI|nr:diaminopimelate epimerase [Candidatus Eisenbacteria bacterium]
MSGEIRFVKMHGAGNDFIMLNGIEGLPVLDRGIIAALCHRRRGIGADGLIVILPGGAADFRMVYYNSDGGEADMCGNGARCAARYAFDLGVASSPMSFETRCGIVEAEIRGGDVLVGIGVVRGTFTGLRLDGIEGEVHFADSGVPHAVVLHEDAESVPAGEFLLMARMLRYHERFGVGGANVNLATVLGEHEISYRTFERGVEGETEACGTGAAAVSVVTAHLGLTSSPVTCLTSGGDRIVVGFDISDGGATGCTLLGPAAAAFEGMFRPETFGIRTP